LDGDLDMFLTHWGTLDELYGEPPRRQTDHLWRNESDRSGIRYVNVSDPTGVSELTRSIRVADFHGQHQIGDFTFTATFARFDGDLWPDLTVAADFGTTQVFINNRDGTFRRLENAVLRDAQFGMGSALGDIDNDGDLDWFVTSILGPGDEKVNLEPWQPLLLERWQPLSARRRRRATRRRGRLLRLGRLFPRHRQRHRSRHLSHERLPGVVSHTARRLPDRCQPRVRDERRRHVHRSSRRAGARSTHVGARRSLRGF